MYNSSWYLRPLKTHSDKHLTLEATGKKLNNFQWQKNESIADLHTTLTFLLEKCSYNQFCMNTSKTDHFIHAFRTLP